MALPVTRSAPQTGMAMLFGQPSAPAPPPQRPALLARLAASLTRSLGVASRKGRVTSEGGVAGSASPSVSGAARQTLVWERRALVRDLWNLYSTDARFRAAVEKHVHKATAGGFCLKVSPRDGTTGARARRAQNEAEALLRRVGLIGRDGRPDAALLAKWLRHGRVEGDLFLQRVIAWSGDGQTGEVVKLKVMPAESMERLSDDTDEFPDPARAFVQIDVNTQQVVPGGEFAAFQIGHHRWKQIGEDRYGQSEYAAARDPYRTLENLEKYQHTRRMSNASRIEEHTLGKESGAASEKDIAAYRKDISALDSAAEVSADPYHQLGKYVHNQDVEIAVHPSDPSVHEIADLVYFLEKEGAAGGTPIQLSGQNVAGIARDTLDLVVSEWLDGMAYDVAWVYGVVLEVVCLQLELKGLAPDAFDISLSVPARVFESATDCVAFVTKAMTNTLGAGMNAKPFPLLTPETAVRMLGEYIGIDDAEGYVKKLEAMMAEKHIDADTVHDMQIAGADPGVQNGSANSKTSGSASPSGHGQRFENGKVKDGSRSQGGDSYRKLP